MKRWYLFSILILMAVSAYAVDFDTEIQPIFSSNCVGCHGNSGGLSLAVGSSYDNLVDVVSNNYGPAVRVVPGDPTASVLYNKVAGTGVNGQRMPQDGQLTAEQIALISSWITEIGVATPITIAEARATAATEIVTVTGIVTSPNFSNTGARAEYTIQDATGGIVLFAYSFDVGPDGAGLSLGDEVTITGEITPYNGLVEIEPATPADVVVESSGNDLPAFQVLTIAQILASPEEFESELVRIDSATIVSGTWPTSTSSSNMTITDPSGELHVMRIDGNTNIHEHAEFLGYFNLQTVTGQYDTSDPWDSGYQVFPRYYTDFDQIGDPTPQISNIHRDPASPTPADEVMVSATIIDNHEVASAALTYTVDSGIEVVVAMTAGENNMYSGVIPAQVGLAVVSYSVSATDNFGGLSSSAWYPYVVYGGTVNSIASIQDGTIPEGTIVTVQGVVTAEPYAFYPEDGLLYYYIQDDYAPLSGIKVYDPGRAIKQGDEVRLTGTTDEYFGMTELVEVTELEILSSGNSMEPLLVTLGGDMEMYEGCLIEIQNVTVSNPAMDHGEWSVTDGTSEQVIDDAADYFYYPVQDEALASIVGVLDYSFDVFKLEPRLAMDVQTADGLTRIQAIQQVRYSDLMPHYTALDSTLYFEDTSYYDETFTDTMIVTVQGVVTMPTGLSYAGAGVKFILQDVNGGPWFSILSYSPDSTTFPVLFEGDLVELTGRISEFVTTEGSSTSNMTELWITAEANLLNDGLPVPIPVEPVIATGDLRWPTTAEQWGNVVVKVENAVITVNNPTTFDILTIDDGSGGVLVDDDSDSLSNYIQPPVGSVFDEVRGWVYHHYGSYVDSSTYKLVPLYQNDLVLNTSAIDHLVVPEGYALGNYPNPFNPTTTIAYRIPAAQPVKLLIYNQIGQYVTTLVDQPMMAGEYQVSWNGLDAKGRPVSSGLYFYRMLAGSEQLVGKMTYLK